MAVNTTELERLVVRLIGDPASFNKMLKDATKDTDKTAKDVEAATGKIEGFGKGLESFGRGVVGALAALGATSFLKSSLESFQMQESANLRLKAALQSNNRDVEGLTKRYDAFAKSVSWATVVSDQQVTMLLQLAESFGLTGDSAERAVRNAIALSAATGKQVNETIRATAALEQGNAEALGEVIPTIKAIQDPTLKAAAAQKELAKMFGIARAEAGTSAGKIQQLANSYANFKEGIGAIVVEALGPFVDLLRKGVMWFQGLSKETKTAIVVVAGLVAAVGALAAAFALAVPLLGLLGAGFLPLVAGAALVGAGIAAWVDSVGGVGNAVAILQAKWDEFYETVLPTLLAIKSMGQAVWERVQQLGSFAAERIGQAWEKFSTFFSKAMAAIGLSGVTSFTEVAEKIEEFAIAAEFMVRNFGRVWDLAMNEVALFAVRTGNQIEHVFVSVIPTLVKYGAGVMVDVFKGAANFVKDVFVNLGSNLKELGKKLPDLIKGKISVADLFGDLKGDFEFNIRQFPGIAQREMGAVEKNLQELRDRQKADLAGDLSDFMAMRKKEFAQAGKEAGKAQDDLVIASGKAGDQITKNLVGAVERFDAALRNSAEAITRYQTYLDMIRSPLGGNVTRQAASFTGRELEAMFVGQGGGLGAAGVGGPGKAPPAVVAEGGEALKRVAQILDVVGGGGRNLFAFVAENRRAEAMPEQPVAVPAAVQVVPNDPLAGDNPAIRLLREIRDDARNRPVVQVEGAGLE